MEPARADSSATAPAEAEADSKHESQATDRASDATGQETPAKPETPKPETPKPETPKPEPAKPEPPKRDWRSEGLRVLLAIAGLAMFVGFFLPWMQLGSLMEASGFQLILGSGEMVDRFVGSQRMVLVVVPLLGTLLVLSAVVGHRVVPWLAVLSGLTVLGYGLLRLLTFFFETTGIGIWLIVGAAIVALAAGMLGIGFQRRR